MDEPENCMETVPAPRICCCPGNWEARRAKQGGEEQCGTSHATALETALRSEGYWSSSEPRLFTLWGHIAPWTRIGSRR